MLSSMTPTLLMTEERLAALGTPGGSRIISMVLLAALAWVEGGDAAAMVGRSRFHHQYSPDLVFHEPGGLTEEEQRVLQRLGHELRAVNRDYGDMHVVTWDLATGAVDAASDPRGIGEPRFAPVERALPAAAR
jgi:gamma-glutamyltranspeptidase/glutathione hydrolase